MKFDFDRPVNRTGTDSVKWNKYPDGVLPMWVADMDFESPEEISAALQKLVDRKVYGYAEAPAALYEIIAERLHTRHHWKVEPAWIVPLPGLVPGLHAAPRILDVGRSEIITSVPVYYHLSSSGRNAGLSVRHVPFAWNNNRWEMDFEGIEASVNTNTGMYMLCNPHNPNGRVFDRTELSTLAGLVVKHDLILVSDEIHCDLILDDTRSHISIASLDPEIEKRSITLLSPSKTFNIAGLGGSFAVIPDAGLRQRFTSACFGIMPRLGAWAFEAMMAAYRYGEPWRQELTAYLKRNHDFLLENFSRIPGLSMHSHEATYLAWIRCDHPDIEDIEGHLINFGLGVSGGPQFFANGYFRLNFGTQFSNVQEAVIRLERAFR